MKLPLSFLVFAIAGFISPEGAAGQQSGDVGWGQKARPDPVPLSQAQQQGGARTIGICHPIENRLESRLSAVNGISPILSAFAYLRDIEHRKIDESVFNNAKMTLLQAPTHGTLELYEKYQAGSYDSLDYNYTGPDRATVLVEIGDYKVKVIYHFVLMQNVPGSNEEGTATDNKSICPNGYMWKITTTNDASGNFIVSSIDYLPPTTSAAGATVGDIATFTKMGTDLFTSTHTSNPRYQSRLVSDELR